MNISKLVYELYKVDWKSYMVTKDIEINSIKNYYKGLVDSEEEYTYNDYIEEFGYDNELYVCYDEFLYNEYQDKKYIRQLLNDNELYNEYLKDIKNRKQKEK